jgi:hypothetical protein
MDAHDHRGGASRPGAGLMRGAAVTTNDEDPEERRIRKYFLGRALEFLEQAKSENDPVHRIDLEKKIAKYWRIAKT